MFESLISKFPNWNSPLTLLFPTPHSFPHPHIYYRKAQKTDTCEPLSHRLQRTETCLLCSISFDCCVPAAPSQHLLCPSQAGFNKYFQYSDYMNYLIRFHLFRLCKISSCQWEFTVLLAHCIQPTCKQLKKRSFIDACGHCFNLLMTCWFELHW